MIAFLNNLTGNQLFLQNRKLSKPNYLQKSVKNSQTIKIQ